MWKWFRIGGRGTTIPYLQTLSTQVLTSFSTCFAFTSWSTVVLMATTASNVYRALAIPTAFARITENVLGRELASETATVCARKDIETMIVASVTKLFTWTKQCSAKMAQFSVFHVMSPVLKVAFLADQEDATSVRVAMRGTTNLAALTWTSVRLNSRAHALATLSASTLRAHSSAIVSNSDLWIPVANSTFSLSL